MTAQMNHATTLRERVRAWWQSTYLYRVFVLRVRQRSQAVQVLCVMQYGLSFFFFLVASFWSINLFEPTLELAEMQTATGVVEKVGQARGCSDTLYLRIKGNGQRKYGVCLTVAEGRALKGQEVTVWSQRRFATFGMEDYINQIQLGDRLIKDYSKIKPNIEMTKRTAPAVIGTFLFLAFMPLGLIWLANGRGPINDQMLADFEGLKKLNYVPSKIMRELFAKYGGISPPIMADYFEAVYGVHATAFIPALGDWSPSSATDIDDQTFNRRVARAIGLSESRIGNRV